MNKKQFYIPRVILLIFLSIPYFISSLFLHVPQAYAATATFSYTGANQTWVVPSGVTSITVDVQGAEGSKDAVQLGTPGKGGRVEGALAVTPGETLTIIVGQKEAAGGGGAVAYGGGGFNWSYYSHSGGHGGGGSDIRQGGSALANRVAVGGGGGGNGGNYASGTGAGAAGGNGGTTTGVSGTQGGATGGGGGSGGTQAAGGAGGSGITNGNDGSNGSLGIGGNGGQNVTFPTASGTTMSPGGGGGGGYYGGGGGEAGTNNGTTSTTAANGGGGGAGGSNYVGGLTGSASTAGFRSGHGQVIFTYTAFPTITTPTQASITTTGATLGGNVTSAGDAAVSGRGVCIGASANPALGGTCFTASGTTGIFTVSATGLTQATTYNYRAYATSSVGTSYTTNDTFTTLAPPTITSPTNTSITTTGATLGGNVTAAGGAAVTGRGVCVGTSANPALGGTCFTASGTTGIFTVSATGLTQATTYNYRAYATNSVGTSYTTNDTFTTGSSVSTISTSAETNVDAGSTTFNTTITPNSSSASAFYLWGPSNVACGSLPNSTASQSLSGGSGVALTAALTGFTPGRTYYYCSVAINSNGITYGTISSFTQTSASGCASTPLGADYSASSSCLFANSTNDGVDKGTGTTNTAVLTIAKGTTLTVSTNQTVAFGSIYKPGATVVRLSGGSLRRGAIWVADADGDGYPDNPGTQGQLIRTTQPSGHARRAVVGGYTQVDCDSTNATKFKNYIGHTDVDQDGYTTSSTAALYCGGSTLAGAGLSATSSGVDCLDSNVNIFTNQTVATDADQDGRSTSTATSQCAGASSTVNGRTYYRNASNVVAFIGTASTLATSDCNDADATKYQNLTVYTDADGDTYGTGASSSVCSGAGASAGYTIVNGTDCNDANANIYQNVSVGTDVDQDGYSTAAAGTVCVGVSSTVSGRTYYRNSAGAVTQLASADIINQPDCNDATAAPCAATTGVAAGGAISTRLDLSWAANTTNGPAPTSYDIYNCSGANCTPSSLLLNQAGTTYSHTGLTQGATYGYKIIAKNAAGSAPETSAFYGIPAAIPTVTTSAASSIAATQVILNSTVNPNGASTNITYRYGTSNVACASLPSTLAGPTGLTGSSNLSGATTQATLTGLTGNTTYYFCATVINSGGTASGSVLSFLTLPGAATSVTLGGSGTTITVTWTAPSGGVASYNLLWCSGASCTPATQITGVTSVYSHTSLTCATSYSYIVVSVNATGTTNSSTATRSTTANTTYYRDVDGDGYGVASPTSASCTGAPAGYVASSTDCYDSGTNAANAYPGQTTYYTAARGDGSWDYNCSSANDKLYNGYFTNLGVNAGSINRSYNDTCHCGYSSGCGCCSQVSLTQYWVQQSGQSAPACGIAYNPCVYWYASIYINTTNCTGAIAQIMTNCAASASSTQSCR